ncbi:MULTISPECIES: hypothetical protein [unclassified Paenibacillus]|uniref:hypothetical protein n=1 Tax=unclassified Paenibacillus TaxID=185978 RepID=UPI001AE10AC8|nr:MULTISPECIES: hypothetical protein [unclassified Paenibacillus]MBP1153875.1 hypothetical protein [Paenibacillus sp. PvP091]MBP1170740.1 hypothetical protein [Paenibacillus sp. PvR098]MBP2441768.1 hypothetical protein [Paenibacillus sp. PvP052]
MNDVVKLILFQAYLLLFHWMIVHDAISRMLVYLGCLLFLSLFFFSISPLNRATEKYRGVYNELFISLICFHLFISFISGSKQRENVILFTFAAIFVLTVNGHWSIEERPEGTMVKLFYCLLILSIAAAAVLKLASGAMSIG